MGELKNGNKKHQLTVEDARKGGRKSAESRAKRKSIREAFEAICSDSYRDSNGNKVDGITAMCLKQFQAALNGDTKAFVEIRNSLGEMPVQKIETVEIPPETYEKVMRVLSEEAE